MLGNFQSSNLRIEIEASQTAIRDSLIRPDRLRQWLWFGQFSSGLPGVLESGVKFTSWVGPVAIAHEVELANSHCLRFLLSQGIDGFHEWRWGEGWVQSCLEGITLLPLNLGQTVSLLQLRQFLTRPNDLRSP